MRGLPRRVRGEIRGFAGRGGNDGCAFAAPRVQHDNNIKLVGTSLKGYSPYRRLDVGSGVSLLTSAIQVLQERSSFFPWGTWWASKSPQGILF